MLTDAAGAGMTVELPSLVEPKEGKKTAEWSTTGTSWRNVTAKATFVLPDGTRITPSTQVGGASPAWRVTGSVVPQADTTLVLATIYERHAGTTGSAYPTNMDRIELRASDVRSWTVEAKDGAGATVRTSEWTLSFGQIRVEIPGVVTDPALVFEVQRGDHVITEDDAQVHLRTDPGSRLPGQ